ncbi:MAG TPA: hypothetical protein VEL47_01490 [Myxococcota bacterium]|nr:hypothetical protein [Myxococcota bacterium]
MQNATVIDDLLPRIIPEPVMHGRFLNTLSLMELSGAHRLSRFVQNSVSVSNFLLEHVSEEYRHAFFLRRLAHKVSNDAITSYDDQHVFSKRTSLGYVRALDRKIVVALKNHGFRHREMRPHLAYLLVTLAIEARALPFYQRYQAILEKFDLTLSVKSIVSEEQHHLQQINHSVARENIPQELIEECYAIEAELFENWTASLAQEIHTLLPT